MSDSGDEAVAFTCLDLDCEPIRYIIDIVSNRLAIQVNTVSAATSSKIRHTQGRRLHLVWGGAHFR